MDLKDKKITSVTLWNQSAIDFRDQIHRGDRIQIKNFRTIKKNPNYDFVESKPFIIALEKNMLKNT